MNGILFKPDIHLAIREDRKTVTRRLDGLKEINKHIDDWIYKGEVVTSTRGAVIDYKGEQGWQFNNIKTGEIVIIKPHYHVGEIVYIKEAWWTYSGSNGIHFSLDEPPNKLSRHFGKLHSPMFLKAKDARDFIQMTDINYQRLHEITEADALAEGIIVSQGTHQPFEWDESTSKLHLVGKPEPFTARYHYEALWDSINARIRSEDRLYTLDDKSNRHFVKDQVSTYAWASNPWVVRYQFKRVEKP